MNKSNIRIIILLMILFFFCIFAAVILLGNTAARESAEGSEPVASGGHLRCCLSGQDFARDLPALDARTLELTPYLERSHSREPLRAAGLMSSGSARLPGVYPGHGWQSQMALQTRSQREWQMLFPFHFFL